VLIRQRRRVFLLCREARRRKSPMCRVICASENTVSSTNSSERSGLASDAPSVQKQQWRDSYVHFTGNLGITTAYSTNQHGLARTA
jgi:hypothetical protein